ncbi:hypothetical protein [Ornithinimicrobium kibberense]|uniref:hypothetical protein n=1 Tax=Ornithinimicrobium kibberense TaxID=282060 RepID=UPI0036187114
MLQTHGQHEEEGQGGQPPDDDEGQAEGGLAPPADAVEPEDGSEDHAGRHQEGQRLPSDVPAEHRGDEQAEDDRDDPHGDRRQLWVGHPVVEPDRAEVLEQHRGPEDGQGEEEEGQEGDRVVEPGVLADRGEDAQGDADDDGQGHRQGDQPQAGSRRPQQEAVDVGAVPGGTEVALEHQALAGPGQPGQVALPPRHVQVHVADPRLDELLAVLGAGLPQVLQRVSGVDGGEVHQRRTQDQDHRRDGDPAEDELEHGEYLPALGPRRRGGGDVAL